MKVSCTVRVPARGYDKALNPAIRAAVQTASIYSTVALIAGVLSIIGGMGMCVLGVSGHTSFTTNMPGINTNVTDAAPGVVLMFLGTIMMWKARPDFDFSVVNKEPKDLRPSS